MKIIIIEVCCFMAVGLQAGEPCPVERSLAGREATVRDGTERVVTSTSKSGDSTTFRDASGRIISSARVK